MSDRIRLSRHLQAERVIARILMAVRAAGADQLAAQAAVPPDTLQGVGDDGWAPPVWVLFALEEAANEIIPPVRARLRIGDVCQYFKDLDDAFSEWLCNGGRETEDFGRSLLNKIAPRSCDEAGMRKRYLARRIVRARQLLVYRAHLRQVAAQPVSRGCK